MILVVLASGCFSNDPKPNEVIITGASNTSFYQINIDYPGKWSGKIKYYMVLNNSARVNNGIDISGTKENIYSITQNVKGLQINATKGDYTTNTLTITIQKEGQIIKSNSTSEPGGSVNLVFGDYQTIQSTADMDWGR